MADKYKLTFPCFNETFNMTVYSQSFRCSKIEINLSTCQPIQGPDEIDTIQSLCDAADIIWYTGFWFAVITGVIGNGLAILTIASLPKSTATFLVGLLAASDLLAICIRAVLYFCDVYHLVSRLSPYWDLFPMLTDLSASYSNWLLVLICLERFLTVRFPLHKRHYFTLTHAKISAFTLAVTLFTIYNVMTWTMSYENAKIFKIRNLLYAGLPLAFILVIIGLISYQLKRIHKDRQVLNGRVHSRVTLSSMDDPQTSVNKGSARKQGAVTLQEIAKLENSITIMMLVAAICFSLLTLPDCIMFYTYHYSVVSWNTPVLRALWHMLRKLSQVFCFLNLSVNFTLYFLSAKRFRSQLYKVLNPRVSLRRSTSHPPLPIVNNCHTNNNNNNNDSSSSAPIQPIESGDYVTFQINIDGSPPSRAGANGFLRDHQETVPLTAVREETEVQPPQEHVSSHERRENNKKHNTILYSAINGNKPGSMV